MTEMKVIEGKCKCKKRFDIRISNNKQEIKKDKSLQPFWLIYCICNKCKSITFSTIFFQQEEPKNNIDFYIDYNKIPETTKHLNLKEKVTNR